MDGHSTDVMIIGAGPTGLMLAVCLERLGVPFLIADHKHGPTIESRALALQARSLEIYDQLGLADRVLAGASAAPAIVPGFRDRPFATFSFRGLGGDLTPYPGIYVFEQSRNERLLVDALEEDGRGVLWGHRLEALERDAGGVTALLRDDDGAPARVRARYLVGADGASSAVRELSGIPFDGVTNPHTFYVADARGVQGLVPDCVNLRFSATDFLLTFPQGAPGRHRLIGVVRTDGGEEVSEESAHATLAREFGVRFDDTAWFSTYRVHHRVARRFRDGPVFLAGDAAHVHSPVGAQGMNTGLQDAHNLACALADVIHNGAAEDRLDGYQEDRRPVARTLVRSTDRLFGAVTADSPFSRFIRSEVLPRVAPVAGRILPRLAKRAGLFEYVSQIRIHYWMDPDARRRAHGRRGAVVGRRLPWNGDNFAALREFAWQLHVYGDADDAALERMGKESRLPVHHFDVLGNARLRAEASGAAGVVLLVRPDGFVAAARPLPASVADWAMHAPRAGGPRTRRG
ncbi:MULTISPECIES: FAD-dependent monooxygenase [Arthrobacter]|uniref:FAD-dependent monooxygenase n=2 Tax=Arthrobacter TaxID=1663 RepID=A0ABU9KH89_9MICC|nr:FAD-dependent monooxygenase [Arthrobacter sp. YJM1]MDP5226255.1 FAD-dependent monooxygenase [Arthrobacter sp. YJM1]